MKHIVVILDGAAGWPLEQLDGATTLEMASTPILDTMARDGIVGLAKTVPDGAEPSSSAACTSILGFDPVANYVGRSAIEAAAMGTTLAPDEVAFRLNTVTVTDGTMTSYACGHISTEASTQIINRLAAELNDDTFTLYPGLAYRHILVVKGHPELADLQCTPPHDISDQPIEGRTPQGEGAELLHDYMQRAAALLVDDPTCAQRAAEGKLPCTAVWPFWPGVAVQDLPSFGQTYDGHTCALTSGVDLLAGLALLFGITNLTIDGVTDGPDTDYVGQVKGALEALDTHDVVVVHVEAPDEMGHAGDVDGKIQAIESIDMHIMTRVFAYAKQRGDVRVLALPDHPTPIAIKTHVGESVPFLLWGAGIASNGAASYDEIEAQNTGLIVDPGHGLMSWLLGTV